MGATIFDRMAREIESNYSAESSEDDNTAESYINNNDW